MHATGTIFVVETYFLPTVGNEILFRNMQIRKVDFF